jgi:magnesium transporter
MIQIFKNANGALAEIESKEKDSWIKVTSPTQEEVAKLSRELNIPLAFLMDPLDVDERARVEKDDGYTLAVIRIPWFDEKNAKIPFSTLPLGIIMNSDRIITVCGRDTDVLLDFLVGKVRNFSIEHRVRFLIQVFLRVSLLYLKYLRQINTMTEQVERELHKALKNEELIKLLDIEKSLVFFITSLKSNELMMDRLFRTNIIAIDEDSKELLEDVIIETRQAIEMANIYSSIESGMMDAFASVISNNLNVVLKFLTSVTIILMLPTLVASIYGMNVPLPFQRSPHAFLIVVGFSFLLSVLVVLIFMKRKYF